MDKNEQQIMVVKRDLLFGNYYFEGFRAGNAVDYEKRVLENYEFMGRVDAEQNPKFKQPIAYALIFDEKFSDVFSYQRPPNKNCHEERLQGKWSWGIGGHIEKVDIHVTAPCNQSNLDSVQIQKQKNPIRISILRELGEEIGISSIISARVLGYINDDGDDVGKVHFGILYVIPANTIGLRISNGEIMCGRFRSLERLEIMLNSGSYDIENWSRIALEPLKSYLTRNSV